MEYLDEWFAIGKALLLGTGMLLLFSLLVRCPELIIVVIVAKAIHAGMG